MLARLLTLFTYDHLELPGDLGNDYVKNILLYGAAGNFFCTIFRRAVKAGAFHLLPDTIKHVIKRHECMDFFYFSPFQKFTTSRTSSAKIKDNAPLDNKEELGPRYLRLGCEGCSLLLKQLLSVGEEKALGLALLFRKEGDKNNVLPGRDEFGGREITHLSRGTLCSVHGSCIFLKDGISVFGFSGEIIQKLCIGTWGIAVYLAFKRSGELCYYRRDLRTPHYYQDGVLKGRERQVDGPEQHEMLLHVSFWDW